jgi:poly [ADP-ribose] polymerase
MADVIEREEMLILVDGIDNHNKFYHATLFSTGAIKIHYGRVGGSGAYSNQSGGPVAFERIIRGKMRKGYERTEVVTTTKAKETGDQSHLTEVAKTVLVGEHGNPELESLIERLVRINRHEIIEASGGLIKVDADSGRMSTPLGLISLSSINDARRLIDKLEGLKVSDADFLPALQNYLKLVPQKVPAKRGWYETFFDGADSYQKQRELLDQLADSIKFAEANKDAEKKATTADDDIATKYERLFKYKVAVLDPESDEYKGIVKKYQDAKNAHHSWGYLKVKRIFTVSDEEGQKRFDEIAKEIGNVQQLWHGSRSFNILSILRRGLFVPPTTGGQYVIAGRMFGDGIYLSNDSTKSLGYSHGYWSGSRDNSCFMFLADVAMGSEYRTGRNYDKNYPRYARTEKNKFGKPFNSINVRPGYGGVRNHEAIVWNTEQVNIKYLVEFES